MSEDDTVKSQLFLDHQKFGSAEKPKYAENLLMAQKQ